jgi:hypothetical protein
MTIRTAVVIAALGASLGLGLAGCETVTPYQPLQHGNRISGGFTDQKLDSDHFRITFKGNYATPRSTVESYLLYHAAEVTVAQGYDWFETVERHTDKQKETYVDSFYGGYGFGYYHHGFGGFYGPYGYGRFGYGFGPFGGAYDVHTEQQFEASADIALRHGPKPAGDARALDAREVLTNLGPKIRLPTK